MNHLNSGWKSEKEEKNKQKNKNQFAIYTELSYETYWKEM